MKQVIVTTSWDDGHKLDMRLARLLKKYGLRATFYIAPEDCEFQKDDRLSDADIIQIGKDFEIGAHTMTHPRLTRIDNNSAKQEIITSKNYLEKVTGKAVNCFCYPGGFYSSDHIQMLKNAGFGYARTISRFNFQLPKNKLEAATSVHAYRHWSDIFKILRYANFNPSKFVKFLLNWDQLANSMFDTANKNGSVFHIWGHSWEIDANEDWARLENVFQYISAKPDVRYVTNGELSCLPDKKSSL